MDVEVSRRSLELKGLVGNRTFVSTFVELFRENQEKLPVFFLACEDGVFDSGGLFAFWLQGKVPERPLTRGGPFGVSWLLSFDSP